MGDLVNCFIMISGQVAESICQVNSEASFEGFVGFVRLVCLLVNSVVSSKLSHNFSTIASTLPTNQFPSNFPHLLLQTTKPSSITIKTKFSSEIFQLQLQFLFFSLNNSKGSNSTRQIIQNADENVTGSAVMEVQDQIERKASRVRQSSKAKREIQIQTLSLSIS
jgi:biopolymer transport protein ExbD